MRTKKQAIAGFMPGQKTKKKGYRTIGIKQAGLILPLRIQGSLSEAIKNGIIKESKKGTHDL